jgi:hypothetical protein
MKLLTKSLIAGAVALTSVSSFATSSQAGLDAAGNGVVTVTGTAVGTCMAPTFNVALNNIDFNTAKNGPTGVYEHPVTLNVSCSNPNQYWNIVPVSTVQFQLSSGINGAVAENAYVSLTSLTGIPGGEWDEEVWGYAAVYNSNGDYVGTAPSNTGLSGRGNTSVGAKLIFGRYAGVDSNGAPYMQDIYQVDENGFMVLDANGNGIVIGQIEDYDPEANPVGTITGRGTFNADIVLEMRF